MSEAETHFSAQEHGLLVGCAVLTVSDTRTARTDRSGPLVERLLVEGGHRIVDRAIVPDVPDRIARQLETWLEDPDVHAIVTTGGTGIALRDTTIEVVRRYLAIEIEGFGELFRMLSYERVKAAAMLSRAAAGLATDGGDDGRTDRRPMPCIRGDHEAGFCLTRSMPFGRKASGSPLALLTS